MTRRRAADGGFTLVELLVVLGILVVVAPAVTGAVVVGFRTVGSTQDDVTGSAALGAFVSRFTADVHAATSVDTADPPAGCADAAGSTVVHLGTADGDVYYAFDGPTDRLLRSACGGTAPAGTTVLGVLGSGVFGGDGRRALEPVVLACGTDTDPCPAARAVTVTLQLDAGVPAVPVTAVRLVST